MDRDRVNKGPRCDSSFLFVVLAALSCVTPRAQEPAPTVSSHVHSFSRIDRSKTRFRYSFVELPDQAVSLEYKTYQEQVRKNLAALGWKECNAGDSEVSVGFVYGIDDGKEHKVSMPVWGQTGVASAVTNVQPDYFGNYVASTNFIPRYGVVGYSDASYTEYSRRLALYVFNTDSAGLPFHEVRVTSVGSVAVLSEVMPCMVRSLFEGFPAANGESKVVLREHTQAACAPLRPTRDWALEDEIEEGFARLRRSDLDGAAALARKVIKIGNQSQVERSWMLLGAVSCVRNDSASVAKASAISRRVYDYLEEFCATRGVSLPPRSGRR